MDALSILAGGYGSITLHGVTDYTTHKFVCLLVTSDAVFANLEETTRNGAAGDSDIDVMTAAEQNITGALTIPAGTVKTPARDFFTRVKLVSGTVEGYKA
jgi:hypothetical protein